jgi:hypothetical protein
MRLRDLDPKLSDSGWLRINCPVCVGDKAHSLRIPLFPAHTSDGKSWQRTGEFPDTLTVTPSVNFGSGCWHGNISNGEVT